MNKKCIALSLVLFLFLVLPAQADTPFTVYGQVFDTDNTPLNGLTVSLSVGGSTISNTTANLTDVNGTPIPGYFYFPSLPADNVSAGTLMTLTVSMTGKSASATVARATTEPQRVDLKLSTGGSSGGSSGGGSSSGSSSGGGGGGGGASGENYSNIQKQESREEFMVKDLPTKYTFTTPELPVSEITITGTTNAGLITTQIELLKSVSTLVKENAPGTIYKYVNIWVGTSGFAVPQNIKEATIKFKVENSWLASGSLKDTDVIMSRWDGSKWNSLETQMINKDENFTYYQAKTNAFSPFAISNVKGLGAATAIPTVTETTVNPTTPTPTPVATKKISGFEVVLGITMLSAVYIFRRKRG
jgi:PGF-pre-PGF domain-containing protein